MPGHRLQALPSLLLQRKADERARWGELLALRCGPSAGVEAVLELTEHVVPPGRSAFPVNFPPAKREEGAGEGAGVDEDEDEDALRWPEGLPAPRYLRMVQGGEKLELEGGGEENRPGAAPSTSSNLRSRLPWFRYFISPADGHTFARPLRAFPVAILEALEGAVGGEAGAEGPLVELSNPRFFAWLAAAEAAQAGSAGAAAPQCAAPAKRFVVFRRFDRLGLPEIDWNKKPLAGGARMLQAVSFTTGHTLRVLASAAPPAGLQGAAAAQPAPEIATAAETRAMLDDPAAWAAAPPAHARYGRPGALLAAVRRLQAAFECAAEVDARFARLLLSAPQKQVTAHPAVKSTDYR